MRDLRALRIGFSALIVCCCAAAGCARAPIASVPAAAQLPTGYSKPAPSPGPTRVAPAAAYTHFIRGYLLELRNQDAAALADYEGALQFDPGSIALRHHAAALAFRLGRYDEGVAHAEEVLRHDPDHLPTLFLLARWYAANDTKPERAIEFFERMAKVDAGQPEVYLNLGLLYARLNRYADAERTIQHVLEIAPDSSVAHLYLGKIASAQKHWHAAERHLERAIEVAPFAEAGYIALGDLYLQQGDRARAVTVYKRLLDRVDPRDAEAVGRLVHLYLQDRTFDQALVLLDDLLAADPKNVEARVLKGRIYGEIGKPADAIRELEQVVAMRPSDTAAIYFLGRLYDEQKQPDKAIAQFERLVAMNADVTEAYLQLGILYAREKRFDEAQAVVEKIRAKGENRPEVFLVLGYLHTQREDHNRAVEVFEAGVAAQPDNATLHFNLGLAYDKLTRFDRFVSELEEAIRLDPQYAEALNYLGYTYAEKDMKLGEAKELIQRALAIKPEDGAYLDSLGWVHFKLGQWDAAVKDLERAIAALPDDPVIHEHLGDAYLKADRSRDARESWLKSLELDPANTKLIERFKGAGFGDPEAEERFRKAKAKKDAEEPTAVAPIRQNLDQSQSGI
ncbi:MAG: tetratricopeptide repeat protein [Nitrospirota bacterium]